jgi:hypothetical protein
MAVQFALDPTTWDLTLDETGDLALVRDGYEVAQHLRQRLNFFEGEWAWDLRAGVPWYQEILGARRFSTSFDNRVYAESILKTEILETSGVTRLVSFSYELDSPNRAVCFRFHVDTRWGSVGESYFQLATN